MLSKEVLLYIGLFLPAVECTEKKQIQKGLITQNTIEKVSNNEASSFL